MLKVESPLATTRSSGARDWKKLTQSASYTPQSPRPANTAPEARERRAVSARASLVRPHTVPSRPVRGPWSLASRASVPSARRSELTASGRFQKAGMEMLATKKSQGTQQEWKKMHTVHQVVYTDPNREHPRHRLQRILKGLRIIVGFCLALKRYAGEAKDIESTLKELELNLQDNSFNFDINLDKLKETGMVTSPVKHLGQRLRSILYIPPEKRSLEDVRKIFVFLRTLPTFRHWTLPVLLNFCKYAVYQKYEPQQVILRRGHYPEGYYIMLSGTVIVNKWTETPDGQTRHTVFEQKCGDVFGESELLENIPRQVTVVCRTECELLTATREDYLEVVNGPLHKIMDENIEFLRGLRLFREFPCSKLSDSLAEFETKLYSKDSVIVQSSDMSEVLVIVKSGRVKVVAELRTRPKARPRPDPRLQLADVFPEEHERRRDGQPGKHTSLDLEWETGQMRGVMKANILMGVRDPERLIISAGQRPTTDNISKKVESWMLSRPGLSEVYDKLYKNRVQRIQANPMDQAVEKPKDRFTSDADQTQDSNDTKASMMSGISRRIRRITKMAQLQEQKEKERQDKPETEEDDGSQEFVLLDRLEPGAVFGLEGLFLKAPVRLSLVSEGAECISISKKFFLKESNPEVLRAASDVIIRYPSDYYMRAKVKERRDWAKYKHDLLQDVLKPKRSTRMTNA